MTPSPSAASSPPRRRTQAERRADSERRLLEATAHLIAERGTSSVSFSDIAKRAGCSHGLPGYLFGSKTGLLLALIEHAQERFMDLVIDPAMRRADRGGTDGEDQLDALITVVETFLRSLDAPWRHTRALYVLIGEAGGAPSELRAALARHHAVGRAQFAAMIRAAQAAGHARLDIDPDAQAALLLGMMRGVGQQVLLAGEDVDVPSVTAEVTRTLRLSLQT